MFINLQEILNKLSELDNPKVTALCNFICFKIWCYGELVWDSHLPDLDTQLQAFTDQELIDLGCKLSEICKPSTQILISWLISKSERLNNIVCCIELDPEIEQCRNDLRDCICKENIILHGFLKFCNKKSVLQEALNAVNKKKQNLEMQKLAQQLQEKIEGLP